MRRAYVAVRKSRIASQRYEQVSVRQRDAVHYGAPCCHQAMLLRSPAPAAYHDQLQAQKRIF